MVQGIKYKVTEDIVYDLSRNKEGRIPKSELAKVWGKMVSCEIKEGVSVELVVSDFVMKYSTSYKSICLLS